VLIYGTHGIGKSTFGACAPKPVFIPTEDGLQDIECDAFPLAESYDAVMQATYELATEPHDFKSLVIDSVDWLERLVWKAVCEEKGKADIQEIGYGKGFEFAVSRWNELLKLLERCNIEREMLVILTGHAKVEKFNNPETEPYDRFVPRLHKSAAAIVQEWCDEVLFANYKVYTKDTDLGFDKVRTRGISSGDRVLRTTERPAHLAKNRLGLPEEIPLAFASYWEFAEKKSAPTKTPLQEEADAAFGPGEPLAAAS
jgi:hypothetical protein